VSPLTAPLEPLAPPPAPLAVAVPGLAPPPPLPVVEVDPLLVAPVLVEPLAAPPAPLLDAPLLDAPLLDAPLLDATLLDAPPPPDELLPVVLLDPDWPPVPPSTEGVHAPPWQVPTEHGVPSARGGSEQWPLVGSHDPTPWHSSSGVQVKGVPLAQIPA
jgi:hypothetical protein